MKSQLLKVSTMPAQSFSVRQDVVPTINNRWHYHPELELIYFSAGTGTQFVGDSIQRFQAGDMLLIGADLPHFWSFDDVYFQDEEQGKMDVHINDIYDFTLSNFKRKIPLEEISAIAGVSPNSFCRYFKSSTGKTYSQFLIETKVGYACKLLIENKFMIKQLCYESGFHNFSSFHKYFKNITGKSPLEYQKGYLSNNIRY